GLRLLARRQDDPGRQHGRSRAGNVPMAGWETDPRPVPAARRRAGGDSDGVAVAEVSPYPWWPPAFRGRPPRLPLAREAAALAALRARPPAAPRRAAIHFCDPSTPSSRAGT